MQPLATAPGRPGSPISLSLFPNPAAAGTTRLTGTASRQPVQVRDLLGRLLLTVQADATGAASLLLPAGTPAGVYLVQAGSATTRLVVE